MTIEGVSKAAAICDTPVQLDINAAAFLMRTPAAPMDVSPAAITGLVFERCATCSTISSSSFVPVSTTLNPLPAQ